MVKIERKVAQLTPIALEAGDVVIIGETPYLISCYNNEGDCLLIGLDDGNRWNDNAFPEGIDMSELLRYTGETYLTFELIKKNQYEMTINIK
ncbi:hypothetical protein ACFVQB_14470 [Paenibacillus sp. NPDC057886]|uniref:hypothetical protein n=1 Tax=Paenibacillus sp. NPDC057886 TaxID=3346270 RepID=UPI00368C671A